MLAWLQCLLKRKPKEAKWESIGSPSYRKAIQNLRSGWAGSIRRRAWAGKSSLALHDLRQHNSNIKGRMPLDFTLHPPMHLIIIQNIDYDHVPGEVRWWLTPAEDIDADDWEERRMGCNWPE